MAINKDHFVTLAGNPEKWERELIARCQAGEDLCEVQKDQYEKGFRTAQLHPSLYGWYIRSGTSLDNPDILQGVKTGPTPGTLDGSIEAAIAWGKAWANEDPNNREFFSAGVYLLNVDVAALKPKKEEFYMDLRHAPGPWEVLENGDVRTSTGETFMPPGHTAQEIRANGNLLAEAPELLRLAIEVVKQTIDGGHITNEVHFELRSAIAGPLSTSGVENIATPAWDIPAYPANHPVERAISRLSVSDPLAGDYLRALPTSTLLESPNVSRGSCGAASERFKLFLGKGEELFCYGPTRILRQLNHGATTSAFCEGHIVLDVDGIVWDWTMRQFWTDAPWPLVIPRARLRKFWEVIGPVED